MDSAGDSVGWPGSKSRRGAEFGGKPGATVTGATPVVGSNAVCHGDKWPVSRSLFWTRIWESAKPGRGRDGKRDRVVRHV